MLGDHQTYLGYTLLLCKNNTAHELHELDYKFMLTFLKEMALVSEAVWAAFRPKKLNYELLGNSDAHLHWHLYPRYKNDPRPAEPIWVVPKAERSTVIDPKKRDALKLKLLSSIKAMYAKHHERLPVQHY